MVVLFCEGWWLFYIDGFKLLCIFCVVLLADGDFSFEIFINFFYYNCVVDGTCSCVVLSAWINL